MLWPGEDHICLEQVAWKVAGAGLQPHQELEVTHKDVEAQAMAVALLCQTPFCSDDRECLQVLTRTHRHAQLRK
jgi:hypothetical protein